VAASVALALLTMLPVPGLDGGRVVLLLVEATSGRRLPARVETVAQTVGFLGVAAVILVMAGMEIRRALPERPAPTQDEQAATGAPAPGTARPTEAALTPTLTDNAALAADAGARPSPIAPPSSKTPTPKSPSAPREPGLQPPPTVADPPP
jgi:regulator of sigma E protease